MAALGKIRSKGVALVSIIGLALFAFIAEEAFRSCESTRNHQRQQIGKVLNEKLDIQEYQKMVDEYAEVVKAQQGTENLTEDMNTRVRDMVWNQYVQNTIIAAQAKKLGLTVTDAEMQNVLTAGTNPMLAQTPFVNQQTGRFDVSQLKTFLSQYETAKNTPQGQQMEILYKFWLYTEKSIRANLLANKYNTLLRACILSNKTEAKMAFDGSATENTIEVAAFPYSSVEDASIEISDADLKAKYNEMKSLFLVNAETRDIKYVDFVVKASEADRAALLKQFDNYAADLATTEDPTDVVRKATSNILYSGIPATKAAFPHDIAQMLDSLSTGAVSAVKQNAGDNTINVVKLVAKQQLPDSVQVQTLYVAGVDVTDAQTRADSVINVIKGGEPFDSVAVKFGMNGEKTWITSAMYQTATTLNKENKDYLVGLNQMASGELRKFEVNGGFVVAKVCDRRNIVEKYTAAVIKRTVDFSNDTYREAYNKFSSFVSTCKTIDDIEANAEKEGYVVRDRKMISTSDHNVANVRATGDALKWIFDAKKGEVSPMYVCGENNHLLVVALENVNKKGYATLDNEQVKEAIKTEVMNDKKAAQLTAKAQEVKDVAAAQAQGAIVSTIEQVTFAAPVFVQTTSMSEPALSGAVATLAQGATSKPIRGNAGVYVIKVNEKKTATAQFDEKKELQRLNQRKMQSAGRFMQELYTAADVVDNRYLFFK